MSDENDPAEPPPFIKAGGDVEDIKNADSTVEYDGSYIDAKGSVRRVRNLRSRLGQAAKDSPGWTKIIGVCAVLTLILTAVLVIQA